MHLKSIKQRLELALPSLKPVTQNEERNNQRYIVISNAKSLRAAVDSLDVMGIFSDLLGRLKSSDLYAIANDRISLTNDSYRKIDESLKMLRDSGSSLITILSKITGEEKEFSVTIRLPDVTDFQDLKKVSEDLQLIIGQVVINDTIEGKVEILSVENGSIWIDVFVGTARAVGLLGSIVFSCTVIYQSALAMRNIAGKAKTERLKTELENTRLERQLDLIKGLRKIEAESIFDEHFPGSDEKELINRIDQSMAKYLELLDKGGEIRASLKAPEELQSKFPDPSLIENIRHQVKLLTEISKNRIGEEEQKENDSENSADPQDEKSGTSQPPLLS